MTAPLASVQFDVTEGDRSKAAAIVGSLEDRVLRRLLVGDIAAALAAERAAVARPVLALAEEFTHDGLTYADEAEEDSRRNKPDAFTQHMATSNTYADAAARVRAAVAAALGETGGGQ